MRRAVDRGHKLNYRWVGPRRVLAEISPLVVETEDMVTGQVERVHARRLMFYRPDLDGAPVDPRLFASAEHSTMVYQVASAIRAIRERDCEIQFNVEWDGLHDSEGMTWEPLTRLHENLLGMVEEFLHSSGQRALKRHATAQLNN